MHKEAYNQMNYLLNFYKQDYANVLDVGSFDVNGNYRNHVESRNWKYTGLDLVPGKNVDVVAFTPYSYQFEDDTFDIVMSGSTMEHVKNLQLWVSELTRVLKPNGMLAIITHTQWNYHPHPVDCWRIMPDGMRYLFDMTGYLYSYQIDMYCSTDISAIAFKKVI
jgi:SAM-dependent methyltransferase